MLQHYINFPRNHFLKNLDSHEGVLPSSQADVGVTHSGEDCRLQTETALIKNSVGSPEGLEKQGQLESLPGIIPESSPSPNRRNGRTNSGKSPHPC